MPIYASNINVLGSITGLPLYTNTLSASNLNNIDIQSDVRVSGDVFTRGRLDTGATMFATFRLDSNMPFTTPELTPSSNLFLKYDPTAGDLTTMLKMQLVLPNPNDFNDFTAGYITLPASGLYNIQMQGSFSNDPAKTDARNGVYMKFLNHASSNARMACDFTPAGLVSSSYTGYLLAGDHIQPVFYSNDSNATLVATAGETYVTFTVIATNTPTLSNFVRY